MMKIDQQMESPGNKQSLMSETFREVKCEYLAPLISICGFLCSILLVKKLKVAMLSKWY